MSSGPGFAFVPPQLTASVLAPFPDRSCSCGGKVTTSRARAPTFRFRPSILSEVPLTHGPSLFLMSVPESVAGMRGMSHTEWTRGERLNSRDTLEVVTVVRTWKG